VELDGRRVIVVPVDAWEKRGKRETRTREVGG